MCSRFPKKIKWNKVLENLYFSEEIFFKGYFLFEKLRKDERHLKKKQKEVKREKHNKRKK